MKKIITFLFCTVFFSSAFAQTGRPDWNNRKGVAYNNDAYYKDVIFQRNQEIEKINYQNNYQVQKIIDDCNLNIWEKRDVLNNLEAQRIQKINNILLVYNNTIAYYHRNEKNNPFEHQHRIDIDER